MGTGSTATAVREVPQLKGGMDAGGRNSRSKRKRNRPGIETVGRRAAQRSSRVIMKVVGKKVKKIQLPKRKVGLTVIEEDKIKSKQRGNPNENDEFSLNVRAAPSEPWVDAQFESLDDVDDDGKIISYRFFRSTVFPPRPPRAPAETTKMQHCTACGRMNPPQNTRPIGRPVQIRVLTIWKDFDGEDLICDDCMCDAETDTRKQMRDAGILPDPNYQSVKREITR